MLKSNKLQFAITREDADLESLLISSRGMKEVLLVCSGGDTILALAHKHPELKISAFDFNPVQIEHFKRKCAASVEELNSEEKKGLCQSGNFESLFRSWRKFFNEFILNEKDTFNVFRNNDRSLINQIIRAPYWPVSFDLHFHDEFLRTMFGEAAIQHAPKGSYPRYFQRAFEKDLLQDNFQENPFLQHLFLGEYLKLPEYLGKTTNLKNIELHTGTLFNVPQLSRYDMIQLSNIFDWSNLNEIRETCEYLKQNAKSGATVLVRQINNESPVDEMLAPEFKTDKALAHELLTQDRSLFYSKIIVARKV